MAEQSFDNTLSAPEKKSNTGLIIAIIVIALLLCCCCIALGGAAWRYGDQIMKQFGQVLPLLIAA